MTEQQAAEIQWNKPMTENIITRLAVKRQSHQFQSIFQVILSIL